MELSPYLPTAIFVATIATVVLAVLSYAAFKLRDWRRPEDETPEAVFFRRYQPARPARQAPSAAGEDAAGRGPS